MAGKVSVRQLEKIFANKTETGGNPGRSGVPEDAKVPGVYQVASRLTGKPTDELLNVTVQPRKAVLVLTPFMAENPSKADYMSRFAQRAVQDSSKRNEAPICNHLFYYEFLNTNLTIERDQGFHSVLTWVSKCDILAVYIDQGITQAMQAVINLAQLKSKKIEYRSIASVA